MSKLKANGEDITPELFGAPGLQVLPGQSAVGYDAARALGQE
jgi:hypothetical protein